MSSTNGSHSPAIRAPGDRAVTPTAGPDPRRAPESAPRQRSFLWLYGLIAAAILGVVTLWIVLQRNRQAAELKSNTQQMAIPTVLTVHPETGDGQVHLVLPGTVQALMESSVFAQISGYIKNWQADIGAPVKQGQQLAEIEAPVVEQNLNASMATLGQSQANLALAKTTAARYNALLQIKAVSQQDVDNQNASVAVQEANVASAQAGVDALKQALAFKIVKAPFDGVVTARRVDVGDLVTAGGGTSSGGGTVVSGANVSGASSTELFRVAQTRVLRVYVNVPEHNSVEVVPGITATITLASNPNFKAKGTLVRTAQAIDPSSLTLLAEVDVDNADGKLLPGGYAQVHFDLKDEHPPLLLPGNTILFRAQGTQVGIVGDDHVVHLKDIKIGRDFGTKLEVLEGVQANDAVILNPSDSLTEGEKVQVETKPPAPPKQP